MLEAVLAFQKAGIHSMGLWRRRVEEFGEEKSYEVLTDHGIKASSLSWVGGFTGSGGIPLVESLHDVGVALDLAVQLRAPHVLAVTGPRGGHSRSHLWELLTESLPKVGSHAGERGLKVLLQILVGGAAQKWSSLNSIAAGIDLLKMLGDHRLGLAIDLKSLSRDPQALSRLHDLIPLLGLVVVREFPKSEVEDGVAAPGVVSQREVVRRLEQAGYRGSYELQIAPRHVLPQYYSVVIRNYRVRFLSWLHSSVQKPTVSKSRELAEVNESISVQHV